MDVSKLTNAVRKVLPLKYCGAVIVAAGTASRMGGIDKVMAKLGGEPMIVRTVRALITAKFWPGDKIRAEAKAKMEAAAAQKEQRAKVVVVDADGKETEKVQRLSELTKKEIDELNRKKLEAARKADAEKYGEEYVELPDEDIK